MIPDIGRTRMIAAFFGRSQMSGERKRAGWPFYMIFILLMALVVYPLSAGPAIWLVYGPQTPNWARYAAGTYIRPVVWVIGYLPEWAQSEFSWYMDWWIVRRIAEYQRASLSNAP